MKKRILELELKKNEIKTNHLLHFILTILTGLWIFIWIIATINNDSKRKKLDKEIAQLKLIEASED